MSAPRCRAPLLASLQEPGLFEPDVVMAQLRYSGVLETVRIRKEGFPVRLPFQVFVDRYLHQDAPKLHRPLPTPWWPWEYTAQKAQDLTFTVAHVVHDTRLLLAVIW